LERERERDFDLDFDFAFFAFFGLKSRFIMARCSLSERHFLDFGLREWVQVFFGIL